jgi:ethanolamine permease
VRIDPRNTRSPSFSPGGRTAAGPTCYRSLVGIPGAAIAGIIAVVALVSLYSNSSYRPGVYGTLIYFLVGIAYFAIAGRHRLVLSPEEEFALTRGQHGDPGAEGYGTTHVADIPAGEPVAEEAPAPGQASS